MSSLPLTQQVADAATVAAVVAASAAADVATLQTLRFEYAIAVPSFLSTPWRYLIKE